MASLSTFIRLREPSRSTMARAAKNSTNPDPLGKDDKVDAKMKGPLAGRVFLPTFRGRDDLVRDDDDRAALS